MHRTLRQIIALVALAAFGYIAASWYILSLLGPLLAKAPVPPAVVLVAQLVQGLVLVALAAWGGLVLARKVGLPEPWIGIACPPKGFARTALVSAALGILAAIIIVLGDRLVFASASVAAPAPILAGVLASFYGGIVEEILLRLFAMSLVAFVVMRLARKSKPAPWMMWTAVIVSAILFGIAHLPFTSSLASLTPLVIVRGIALNAIGGALFGYLYWKRGLESAMIAHFSADVIIQLAAAFI